MSGPLGMEADTTRIKKTSPKEYAVRFVLGGAVTAGVSVVAKVLGPVVSGLFLAFPALLVAGVTLVASHDGKRPAGADALGAAVGSIGMVAFGAVVWALSPKLAAWAVLLTGSAAWLCVAMGVWLTLEYMRRTARAG